MLETERKRHFFTASPDVIEGIVETFADEHDGEPDEGARSLCIYQFTDPTGGQRFLTVAVRTNQDGSSVEGNVTLRWRDEPDGQYVELAESLRDRLSSKVELLSLPEARKRKKDQ